MENSAHPYRKQFIEYAMHSEVLQFGDFTLKSGRHSPYFFNTGRFDSGARLARLGYFYACALRESGLDPDVLYGPAYKGIPLVSATAIALAEHFQIDKPFCFNRKETKDHGEGGKLVGAPLSGSVLILDDVITAGTSVRESVEIIHAAGARPCGVLIALDRQETDASGRSAVSRVATEIGIPVISVITLDDIVDFLGSDTHHTDELGAIELHRKQHGISTEIIDNR